MEINAKVDGLDELLKKLSPQRIQKGIQAALNRAASSGKTEMSSQIRERWNISKSDIDKKIKVKKYSANDLKAIINITGDPLSLIYFNPSEVKGGIKTFTKRNKGAIMPGLAQRKGRYRNTRGIKVKILKNKQSTLQKAFFILGKGGTPLVVWRDPSEKVQVGKYMRGKLKAYKIITYPSMFKQHWIMNPVVLKVRLQFKKEWANQKKQILEGKAEWL